jgi:isoleucyl-tRNA synthetase
VLYAVVPADVEMNAEMLEILRDELNVHRVEFMDRAEELVTFSARPNFRALGARFGKRTPRVADAIRALDSATLAAFRQGQALAVEVDGEQLDLEAGDLDLVQEARGDFAIASEGPYTAALDPTITPELRAEGLARELVSRVQRLRKDAGLEVSDRIRLAVGGDMEARAAAEAHRDFVARETLTVALDVTDGRPAEDRYSAIRDVDLDGIQATIGLARATEASVQ